MLDKLPKPPWLCKHCPAALDGGLVGQLWWEHFRLPKELQQINCDVLFNVDAGTVCRFRPAVTMSQDMLSYEPGEIERFGWGKARARLHVLQYLQVASLRFADGAIFLTRHAAKIIQQYTGPLPKMAFIPHGIGEDFVGTAPVPNGWRSITRPLRCLYVSNVAPYKHQWHVVRAIKFLRDNGNDVQLTLTGGGSGGAALQAQRRLDSELANSDPKREFIRQLGFLPQAALPALLSESDFFIFASSCENMPITLLEAMAVGLPIACSNRGPMSEVLEDGGVYFDPEDPHSIAAAIDLLIADTELCSQLAARAKQLSRKYSWRRCADETFTFLKDIATTIGH